MLGFRLDMRLILSAIILSTGAGELASELEATNAAALAAHVAARTHLMNDLAHGKAVVCTMSRSSSPCGSVVDGLEGSTRWHCDPSSLAEGCALAIDLGALHRISDIVVLAASELYGLAVASEAVPPPLVGPQRTQWRPLLLGEGQKQTDRVWHRNRNPAGRDELNLAARFNEGNSPGVLARHLLFRHAAISPVTMHSLQVYGSAVAVAREQSVAPLLPAPLPPLLQARALAPAPTSAATVAAVDHGSWIDLAAQSELNSQCRGRCATCSRVDPESKNPCRFAIDADSSTRWSCPGGSTACTITVDLGAVHRLHKLELDFEDANSLSFTLKVATRAQPSERGTRSGGWRPLMLGNVVAGGLRPVERTQHTPRPRETIDGAIHQRDTVDLDSFYSDVNAPGVLARWVRFQHVSGKYAGVSIWSFGIIGDRIPIDAAALAAAEPELRAESAAAESPVRISVPGKTALDATVKSALDAASVREQYSSLNPKQLLPMPRPKGWSDVARSLFVEDAETARDEATITALHASYPDDRPKGCTTILVKPIHCGEHCAATDMGERSAGSDEKEPCTLITPLGRIMKQIVELWTKLGYKSKEAPPYPFVILHEDLDSSDKDALQRMADANLHPTVHCSIFYVKINMVLDVLPRYVDSKELREYFKRRHPEGNVSLPHRHWQGFGYRVMCRLFGGLIFHAPLLRHFQYYLRVDGGDSRLTAMWFDPFKRMASNNAAYGYLDFAQAAPSIELDKLNKAFDLGLVERGKRSFKDSLLRNFIVTGGEWCVHCARQYNPRCQYNVMYSC